MDPVTSMTGALVEYHCGELVVFSSGMFSDLCRAFMRCDIESAFVGLYYEFPSIYVHISPLSNILSPGFLRSGFLICMLAQRNG